jgi:hypothetical protein
MGGFICDIPLLYVNPLFILCEIYILYELYCIVQYVLYYYDLFHILLSSD